MAIDALLHLGGRPADTTHCGVGTASRGPDTGERYRLLAPSYRFAYVLQPL